MPPFVGACCFLLSAYLRASFAPFRPLPYPQYATLSIRLMSLISVSYSLISVSKPIVLRTCVGYSQRIGYQSSMSQLDAAVARYNKLLETGPDRKSVV